MKFSALLLFSTAVASALLPSHVAGQKKDDENRPARSMCRANVVRTTSASGEVRLSLACKGTCANGNPCEERWLYTYDWANHKTILTRTCYCDDELRPRPCCVAEDAGGGAYIKSTCRVAILYPEGADVGPDGQQSRTPTKDPIGVVCIDDCRKEGQECRRSEQAIQGDAVKVELVDCKCLQLF